jgi:RHS repeat-associated protein
MLAGREVLREWVGLTNGFYARITSNQNQAKNSGNAVYFSLCDKSMMRATGPRVSIRHNVQFSRRYPNDRIARLGLDRSRYDPTEIKARTTLSSYDLAGNATSVTYPSGRVVNYSYDSASRPKTAADGSNGITYATDFQSPPTGCLSGAVCYTPQGTFYALSIGQSSSFTGLNLTHSYNSRLQPSEFKASSSGGNAIDISYGFVDPVTSHNAGHVYSITNNLDATRSQTFTYDSLNRITSALTASTYATSPAHCWGETYILDAWANLNSIAATSNPNYTGCSQESGFSTTADGNNHLPTFSYDASGNTQGDGANSYTWDAESEMKTAAGVTYVYDAQGRRVTKSSGKNYVYGLGGDILAETDGSGNTTAEYVFFGGKRVAMLPAGGNPIYYVEDMLGTSRVTTTNTGVVCYDADFYPYGGERTPYTNNCPAINNYKFQGKERDSETGDDDFGARYYSNRFGRWLSADWSSVPVAVPYANLTNPQTLNLYSMVADDPESFADLDGHTFAQTYQVANPAASSAWDPTNAVSGGEQIGYAGDDSQGSTSNKQQQQQGCCNVDPSVKKAIMDSVNASNSSTADDKKGGFHEEGGQAISITTGDTVTLPAQPGKYSDPRVPGGIATVDPSNAVNPNMKSQIESLLVTWHVHPGGTMTEITGNTQKTSFFVQPPSDVDKKKVSLGINIVVGAGNKQVYFYDSSRIIKQVSLKDFMNKP